MTRIGGEGGLGYNHQQMLAYTWNENSTLTYSSGLVIPTNQWSFVAVVIEPDKATLYLYNTNGLLSATNAIPHTMDVFGNNWRIGDDGCDNPSRTFNGVIDEVAIFTHSLTPAQIEELYAVGADGLAVLINARLLAPNQLEVSWPLGTLLEADNLAGPWTTNAAPLPAH